MVVPAALLLSWRRSLAQGGQSSSW